MEQLDSYLKKKKFTEGTNTMSRKAKSPIPQEMPGLVAHLVAFNSLLWISGSEFPGLGKS